jgi:hypothetical protein
MADFLLGTSEPTLDEWKQIITSEAAKQPELLQAVIVHKSDVPPSPTSRHEQEIETLVRKVANNEDLTFEERELLEAVFRQALQLD